MSEDAPGEEKPEANDDLVLPRDYIEDMAANVGPLVLSAAAEMGRASAPYLVMLANAVRAFEPIRIRLNEMLLEVAPAIAQMMEAAQEAPEKTRRALRILAQNGWYASPSSTPRDCMVWAGEFEAGRKKKTNTALCGHFTRHLATIERALCSNLPNRAKIIRSAFRAHRRRDYAASVPLFLMQADGICWERTKLQLYSRKSLELLNSMLAGERSGAVRNAFLVALLEPMPILAGGKERRLTKGGLHRHSILHGESTNYNTRLNSFRAISLLAYVEWIVRKTDRNQ